NNGENRMNALIRGLIAFCAVALAYCSLEVIYPCWVKTLGKELWTLPVARNTLEENGKISDALDDAVTVVLDRVDARQQVVRDLFDQKLTLMTAAVHFRSAIWKRPNNYLERFRDVFQGQSDDERYCRQVLAVAH